MNDQHDAIYPVTLFYSYAHEDEILCNDLEKHLTLLQRQGVITAWHDRLIIPGIDWAHEIDAHLNEASIILLLISADFLASDYCYGIEMKHALERHMTNEAHVIPILLRPVDWQSAPFEHLQCLPRHGKPVTEWDNRDAAFRDIAQGIRRVAAQQRGPAHALPTISRQNRQRFLKRVRFWIEGMLEQSLPHTRRIELELQERPDALENPFQPTIPEWKPLPRPLPVGTSITQVYDKADGQLLILGEPGAGKTILLLELARTLLERAEQDERQCMPVVFNLSSWAEKHQPLTVWLMEELQTKHRVPRKVAQAWVDSNQVLLLLDGLDEIAKDARVACIQAINMYYDRLLEQGPAPLVICCRSLDYMALPTRVALQQAISIQPLTEKQINDYFQRSQGDLEELRQGLRDDPELYKLAHNPLMLNIFTHAYQGAASVDLPMENAHDAKLDIAQKNLTLLGSYQANIIEQDYPDLNLALAQIFAIYVKRMLDRRSAKTQYASPQTVRWLAWLAKQMVQHNQTEFYLERMQPDWFSSGWSHRFYNAIVRLGIVLTCEVTFLLPGGLAGGLLSNTDFLLQFGVSVGLLFGLIFGLISQVKTTIMPAEVVDWSWATMWRQLVKRELPNALIRILPGGLMCAFLGGFLLLLLSGGKIPKSTADRSPFVNVLILGALCGMMGMFLFGLFNRFANELSCNTATERPLIISHQGIWHILRNSLPAALPFGLLVGLVFGLVFKQVIDPANGLLAGLLLGGANMLLFVLKSQVKTKVTLVEVVNQLWRHAWQGAVKSQLRSVFGVGLGIWLIAYIIQNGSPVNSLYIALLGAAVIRLLMGIISGLSSNMLAERTLVKPNQGIWSSARNSALVGLVFGIIGGLLFGLIFALAFALQGTLNDAWPWILSFGLLGGVISGLAVGLPNGGIACTQHVILRFFLWVSRKTPWNYVRFLDYAADCILLRKVGGGYTFIHRLLLEHFASMST